MRTIWGRDTSSNVRKVIWLLDELGLPYERIDVGGAFGRTDDPAYRRMNPTGLVPTLQEGAFALWESNAILRYIATNDLGGELFWPADPYRRADVDRWMDAQQTVLGRPQNQVFQGLIRTPPERRDHAAIAAAVAEAGRAWAMLDAILATQPYICGPDLSLADMAWGVHVHRWFNMAIERPDAPYLRAWYDRLMERPVYAARCAGPIV